MCRGAGVKVCRRAGVCVVERGGESGGVVVGRLAALRWNLPRFGLALPRGAVHKKQEMKLYIYICMYLSISLYMYIYIYITNFVYIYIYTDKATR